MSKDKTYLCAIVAMAQNRVIGRNGKIPWHCPADLQFFKNITGNHPVIMGRKTYESIPEQFRPLPGRQNIVLTRNEEILQGRQHIRDADQTVWVRDRHEAMLVAKTTPVISRDPIDDEDDGVEFVFVIGGAEIYRQFLPYMTCLYLTVIEGDYEGDAYFPEWPEDWVKTDLTSHPGDDKNPPHRYEIWDRPQP